VEKVDLHGRSLISPHTTRGSARLQNSQSVLSESLPGGAQAVDGDKSRNHDLLYGT